MAIIGTLPNNIQNGQLEDATPLMADFNFIVSQVNANATPLGTLTAPAGTSMLFQQATAPLGWVARVSAAYDDATLRIVIPANFFGTSGSTPVSTFIIGPYQVDGHALSVAELAAHSHTDTGHSHGITDPGHSHTYNWKTGTLPQSGSATQCWVGDQTVNTGSSVTGIAINNGAANLQNTGAGAAHVHTHSPNLKFADHIVAVKS